MYVCTLTIVRAPANSNFMVIFPMNFKGAYVPLMKLIDFGHVAKQNILLAEQGAGDEVSHGGVVHLCRIALEFKNDIFTNSLYF